MCIGKTSQLVFFYEFREPNPSFVVMEVKHFFYHSGELNSCKLDENPNWYIKAVEKDNMAIIYLHCKFLIMREPDLDWFISKGAHHIHDKVFVLFKVTPWQTTGSINKEDNIHCFFGAS